MHDGPEHSAHRRAFAEFERSMIRQRVRAGLRRAMEAGKQLRRPEATRLRKRESRVNCRPAKAMLATAKALGIGTGTVQRIAREMEAVRPFEVVSEVA
jgi:DNA invertase Pin-like site-specific DNA recombinase